MQPSVENINISLTREPRLAPQRHSGQRRIHDGFSLLEVLVSLVIISVSLAAVFQSLSGATRLAVQRENLHEAVRVAHNLLNDAELLKEAVDRTELQDVVAHAPQWRYRIQAEPLLLQFDEDLEAVEIPAMQILDVCVFSTDRYAERRYCIKTWYRQKEGVRREE